jgi:bacillithiol biosynthesis deacetylase BshB1
MTSLDILAIGAHPDDVELSCSGTLIKHQKNGFKTGIIDLSEGELGTRGNIEIRKKEAEKAAEILGVEVRENLKLPDGFINPFDDNQILTLIEQIRKFKPKIVLANAQHDRHPDHGNASMLIERACFMAGLSKIKTDNQAWRPKYVLNYIQDRYIQPHIIIDISPYWETKLQAILAYKSQFYSPTSKEPETYISTPHYLKYVEARNRDWGRFCNVLFAEGFTSKTVLGVQNLGCLI